MAAFKKFFIMVCFSSILLVSCSSINPYTRADEAVLRGDFLEGAAELESQLHVYNEHDEVLLYLDTGMLAHYAKDYEHSADLLQNGERAIEEAFTKSISRSIGSYLLNDNTLEYAGEDYEDIYINVFNSLNYYHQGDLDGALVEIRRSNNKLRALSTKYGTMITSLQRSMLEQEIDVPYDAEAASTAFTDSALARYVSMLFYRGENLWDDVRIDRNFIKLAFANQPSLYPFPLPSSIDEESEIPSGKARLNLISFNGFSPIKIEETMRIPLLLSGNYIKIALPEMISRPSIIAFTEVQMDSGERFHLELLEDIDRIAKETFKLNQSAIYLKTVMRSSAKSTTSAAFQAASEASEDKDDSASALFGVLSLGAQIFAEVSEQADLRAAHYFPGKALVGGINLDPGIYSFTVNYYDTKRRLVYQQRFENISVQENQLNLVEVICLK
jgi:hypothetical protein